MKRLILTVCLMVVAETQLSFGLGVVADRTELNMILGASAVTEDFENITVPDGDFLQFGPGLNSDTVRHGQGPGLIVPGVTFQTQVDTQIYSPAFSGGDSQRLGFSSGSPFTFIFSPPVRAFGVDMFILSGNGASRSIEIEDSNGDIVADISYGTVNSIETPRFFGFENEGGIKRVFIRTFTGGPVFDNVTFGAGVVPEPGTLALAISTGITLLPWNFRKRYNL